MLGYHVKDEFNLYTQYVYRLLQPLLITIHRVVGKIQDLQENPTTPIKSIKKLYLWGWGCPYHPYKKN